MRITPSKNSLKVNKGTPGEIIAQTDEQYH